MIHYNQKTCEYCGKTYNPTGSCSRFCSRKCKDKKRWELYREKRAAEGNPVLDYHGGSYGRKGENHWCYKNGIRRFEKEYRYLIKEQQRYCQHCGKDLQQASSKQWCVHHINHNHKDNRLENLILLCKSCHQKEHKCWENFKKSS